ncbi:NUDIX domain-containing protein [Bacillus sp. AL-1R]
MAGANVILLDSQKRLLLQLRKDNNNWGLPGGSLESGEHLEEVTKIYDQLVMLKPDYNLSNIFKHYKKMKKHVLK